MLEGNFSRTLSWSKTNVVILKHAHVPEFDFHLSGTCNLSARTFTAIVLRVRAARGARLTSGADKGPLVQMVSVRETRELGAERHEDAARDAARQFGVENFREKTSEKIRNKEDRSQKRPGGLR